MQEEGGRGEELQDAIMHLARDTDLVHWIVGEDIDQLEQKKLKEKARCALSNY